MSELFNNILLCQNGDKDAMEYVINKFEGLINASKVSFPQSVHFNNYDIEDNKQDLIVSLIDIVNRIPIENPGFKNEGCLVNYIYKSIINSRKDMYVNKNIRRIFIEDKYLSSMGDSEEDYYIKGIESNVEIEEMLKYLTEKENKVIKYRFIKGKSDTEIGEMLGVSRQAVNRIKNNALKKLKANI